MRKLLFAIECHDCEYTEEIDANGDILPVVDEDEDRYAEIGPAPVVVRNDTVETQEEVDALLQYISAEYKVRVDSIIVYELK